MEKSARISLDRFVVLNTILTTVCCLALLTLLFFCSLSLLWLVVPALLLLATLILFAPRCVSLTDNALVIHRIVGCKRFYYKDIRDVVRYANPDLSWPLMTTRFMGRRGYYRTREFGKFKAYIGCPSDSILILMRTGNNIVFSCECPDAFLQKLRKHLI